MTRRTGWSPEEEEFVETAEAPDDEGYSTIEVLRLLIAEGRSYAETEMERQKLRTRIAGSAFRDAAILGLVALFLLMGMLIAFLIGCIWALAPHSGPFAATLIVLAVSGCVILLLLLTARWRVKAAMRCFASEEDQP